MKIALVGLADSCLEGYDPNAWDRRYHMGQDLWAASATDVFEMHDRDHWGHGQRLEYLARTEATVWMRDWWSDLPNSKAYPLDLVTKDCRLTEPYFECTASYMLGQAISEFPDQIGIYGITGDEGYEQRANLEYLIGVARGRGIQVDVHPNSELFTSRWQCGYYGKQDPKEAA